MIPIEYFCKSLPGEHMLLIRITYSSNKEPGSGWKGQAVVIQVAPGFNLIVRCHKGGLIRLNLTSTPNL